MVKLGRLIPKYFNSLELAEIMIKSQLSLYTDTKQKGLIFHELENAFNEGGYYIKGFRGT